MSGFFVKIGQQQNNVIDSQSGLRGREEEAEEAWGGREEDEVEEEGKEEGNDEAEENAEEEG